MLLFYIPQQLPQNLQTPQLHMDIRESALGPLVLPELAAASGISILGEFHSAEGTPCRLALMHILRIPNPLSS